MAGRIGEVGPGSNSVLLCIKTKTEFWDIAHCIYVQISEHCPGICKLNQRNNKQSSKKGKCTPFV